MGQHQRERVRPGCDRKPRQGNSSQNSLCSIASRQTFGLILAEFDQESDRGKRLVRHLSDAKATHLNQAGQRGGRANQ